MQLPSGTWPVTLVLACSIGCSLTTSLSGFSDPSPSEPGDARGTEAGSTPSGDGGAGLLPDSSVPFCAGPGATHGFCADFDTGGLDDRWNLVQRIGGDVALDTTRFTSGPRALRIAATTPPSNAAVYHAIGRTVSSLSVAFDVSLENIATSSSNVSLAAFYFQTDSFVMHLVVKDGSFNLTQLRAGGGSDDLVLSAIPAPGIWRRLRLDVSVTLPRVAKVYIDGTNVGEMPLLSSIATGVNELAIGASIAQQPANIYIDNVTLDVQ